MPGAEVEGLGNEEAAARGPIVFLTVPFRAQSETLNNLRGALQPGQTLVDCTVPLAAAVSGKATRSLGVWQGSAAQQAQEMAPEGVTVVAALHSVGAPKLGDLDETIDEDVLICGDKKADKAPVAKLIERIEGLTRDQRRAARDGADRRADHAAADLDQRPLQGPRRPQADRPADRGPLGLKTVLLAGGTGGAKLAAGAQELLGDELTVIANTGDDIEALGVHVSPDPDLCTYWLSGEIDPERGWGIKDDSFTVFERLVKLGAPDWFGLSDRDLATCLRRRELLDGRRQADRGAARDRRRARRPRARSCRCATSRSAPGSRCPRSAGASSRSTWSTTAAEPEIEAVEFAGDRGRGADARGPGGDRRRPRRS